MQHTAGDDILKNRKTLVSISVQVTAAVFSFVITLALLHMYTLHQQLEHQCPVCAMTNCQSAAGASSAPLAPVMSTSVKINRIHHFTLLQADTRAVEKIMTFLHRNWL